MDAIIRLMLADNHEQVRAGLVQFLGSSPGIEIVAEASGGAELLEKLSVTQAGLLLLDVTMLGVSGESLVTSIRRAWLDMHSYGAQRA